MIKPEVLDAMVAAGCTAQQVAAAVKADQASSSGAARQARYRARKASLSDERDVTAVTVTDTVSPKESSPTPPKEITPSQSVTEANASSTDNARSRFAAFWSLYPHKVGKSAAEAAFVKALRRVSFETLMAGLEAYAAKTDDRPWCNPATWLNQGRWDDAPAIPFPQARGSPPSRSAPTTSQIFAAMSDRFEDERSPAESPSPRPALAYLSGRS